jgi:hypothetical protein
LHVSSNVCGPHFGFLQDFSSRIRIQIRAQTGLARNSTFSIFRFALVLLGVILQGPPASSRPLQIERARFAFTPNCSIVLPSDPASVGGKAQGLELMGPENSLFSGLVFSEPHLRGDEIEISNGAYWCQHAGRVSASRAGPSDFAFFLGLPFSSSVYAFAARCAIFFALVYVVLSDVRSRKLRVRSAFRVS